MKVTLTSHGGHLAGMRLPPVVVDATALDASKVAELEGLVAAAMSVPAPARSGKARDEMSYTITVDDGGQTTTLSQSDTAMTAEFGRLQSWLQRNRR